MNKKHLGSTLEESVKEWKKDPVMKRLSKGIERDKNLQMSLELSQEKKKIIKENIKSWKKMFEQDVICYLKRKLKERELKMNTSEI